MIRTILLFLSLVGTTYAADTRPYVWAGIEKQYVHSNRGVDVYCPVPDQYTADLGIAKPVFTTKSTSVDVYYRHNSCVNGLDYNIYDGVGVKAIIRF